MDSFGIHPRDMMDVMEDREVWLLPSNDEKKKIVSTVSFVFVLFTKFYNDVTYLKTNSVVIKESLFGKIQTSTWPKRIPEFKSHYKASEKFLTVQSHFEGAISGRIIKFCYSYDAFRSN